MKILAIESSCDETAAAIVKDGRTVLASVIDSQVEEHRKYGGVVPEIASRRHTEAIVGITKKVLDDSALTLSDIDALAVTYAPGLIGALLVGVNFTKALAFSTGKPLIPVHHIRGHIAANYITHPLLAPPFLCLVVSGGHSHIVAVEDYTRFRVIGRTRDDAAGEALDKSARSMGFGYPGGVFIDKAAKLGDPHAYKLPTPRVEGSPFDFSFSGLKTAVVNLVHNATQKGEPVDSNDLAASLQYTMCKILTEKLLLAADETGYKTLAAAGGVSANSGLRAALEAACAQRGLRLFLPSPALCGDNAAMIGAQAYYEFLAGSVADLSLNGCATLPIGG